MSITETTTSVRDWVKHHTKEEIVVHVEWLHDTLNRRKAELERAVLVVQDAQARMDQMGKSLCDLMAAQPQAQVYYVAPFHMELMKAAERVIELGGSSKEFDALEEAVEKSKAWKVGDTA